MRGHAAQLAVLVVAIASQSARGDIYLNNPRGSNNKLSEQNNNRQNNNRLFDSQNNGNGGYQIGDNCQPVCQQNNNNGVYDGNQEGAMKGQMYYYQGSELYIEWTAQHGCGFNNPNVLCQLILQYMCEADNPEIRDGTQRGNNNHAGGNQEPPDAEEARDATLGQHETVEYYLKCKQRQRNKGLYISDQNVRDDRGATATRQNPRGNNNRNDRDGLECPEERDYYPYWHPTPWHDIAVLTDESNTRCGLYRSQSQNVIGKSECSVPEHNNKGACESNGGEWQEQPAFGEPAPECEASIPARDNHHGNSFGGQPSNYIWKIPDYVEGTCVLRLRYNVTTGDFNPTSIANGGGPEKGGRDIGGDYFSIDNSQNGDPVLTNNPKKDFLGFGEDFKLQIQVNTNQYGRTFEDRTHTFKVVPRPKTAFLEPNPRIVNYNVRGRRGNIVQVYPSVEYDFVPSELTIESGTYLHFQWAGSDANARGNAGNGRTGTDRSNLVQIANRQENVPLKAKDQTLLPNEEITKKLSYLGQTTDNCNVDDDNEQSRTNCKQLNGASAYFDGGLVQITETGTHHVMSTRNNDFSNRSHKATIKVIPASLLTWQILVIIGASACALALGIYLAVACYAYRHPHSWLFARRNRPWIIRLMVNGKVLARKEEERRVYIEKEHQMLFGGSTANNKQGRSLDHDPKATGDMSVPWSKYGGCARDRCIKCLAICGLEDGQQLFVIFYMTLNLVLFAAGFLTNTSGGFLEHFAYPLAKGGGYMLDLNLAVVILPTLKTLQTALHGKGGLAREWIPLEDPIKFHRTIGLIIAYCSIVHITGHAIHVYTIANSPLLQEDVLGVFRLNTDEVVSGKSYLDQLLALAMITGILLTLGFLVLFLAAMPCLRRRGWGFRLFQRTHATWPVLYLVLLLHGGQRIWIWLFFPAAFIVVDRLNRMQGQQHDAVLLRARLLPKDVLGLTFEPPEGFTYQAGSYILLNWAGEWHPFTLTSAPEESIISVHIRSPKTLDWCHALRRQLITEGPAIAKGEKGDAHTKEPEPGTVVEYTRLELPGGATCCRPRLKNGDNKTKKSVTDDLNKSLNTRIKEAGAVRLKIAGPFGAPAQRIWEFGPIVVVGAGIGVTPFVSIMRSTQLRAQQWRAILGASKIDASITANKARRKNLKKRKLDHAKMSSMEDEAETKPVSSWFPLWDQWLKGTTKEDSKTSGNGKSGSSTRGPQEGENWNPESLAELVQDVIPVPTKIHFYWIVRTQEELDWFYDLLAAAVEGPVSSIAEVNFFTTQEVETAHIKKLSCPSTQHSGRPNWGPIFKTLRKEHKGENIGVFLCGNPAIGDELATLSKQFSDPPEAEPDRTHFSFFKEHF